MYSGFSWQTGCSTRTRRGFSIIGPEAQPPRITASPAVSITRHIPLSLALAGSEGAAFGRHHEHGRERPDYLGMGGLCRGAPRLSRWIEETAPRPRPSIPGGVQ